MLKIIQKNLNLILNIFFWLLIFPLLYSLTFVNIENIFQFNFSNFYTFIYFLYLIIWTSLLILFRFIKINNNTLREETLYTITSIFFISIFLIPSFFVNHYFLLEHLSESNLYLRSYWRIAFLYFALTLMISPILSFVKNTKVRDNLILSRKILWILSFIFFLKHWLEYFASEYIFQVKYHNDISYFQYSYENMLIRYDALSWFIVWIMMLLLWVTSNKISIKLFSWKRWKSLQSLVYPAFLLTLIHVAFSSRFDSYYIFLFVLVITFRTISYLSKSSDQNKWITTKYICIPCWYIYDENVWDPDSWIEPWTLFKDIPDDWACPICWVTKTDFEPYYDDNNNMFWWYLWEVVNVNMLTEDVLELSIKLDSDIKVLRWQYAIMLLKDFDSEFSRAYSIVESKNQILTFWIKAKDIWRGWRLLKNIKIGDSIKIKWIYWDFVLQNTIQPKVFIATWTWLAPIINMISWWLQWEENHLFFSVQTRKDLFFLDRISNVKNLNKHIYLSREETEEYNYWRIDLTKFDFDKETEFYICWNPWVVNSSKEYLINAWYKNIYSEKFN